jgi:hypothetical protein
MYKAGALNDSKKISAIFSLFFLGLSGASVSKTGCLKRKTVYQSSFKLIKKIAWFMF